MTFYCVTKKPFYSCFKSIEIHVSPGTPFATYKYGKMHCLHSHKWQLSNSEEKYQERLWYFSVSRLYYSIKGSLNTSGIACYAIY